MTGQTELKGRAFLARSSRRIDAALLIGAGTVQLVDQEGKALLEFPLHELRFDPPLGAADRRTTLPDGTLFETSNHDGVVHMTGDDLARALGSAERFSPRLIGVAAAALVGVFAIWKYALPVMVWIAVALTPEPLRDAIDAGSLRAADATLAYPTGLDDDRQLEIQAIFQKLTDELPEEHNRDLTLQFRSIPGLGPNAMALPGGTILMTDALVTQFDDDDVIAAVLGHEMGHVIEDHGLSQLYRSLGIYVLVALIAGDTGPILEDILLEGGVILSFSFSRTHEAEADQFGLRLSDRAGYDPAGLIAFFKALPDAEVTDSGWSSTHPSSGARIEAIKEFLAEN